MDGTQKPFACKSAGCNMRFTNEDHLTVHTKKHAMSLHLGLDSKAASFVADQTPTPTRLIRNLDEIGLFEEIIVNPFDETFRRAVEAKSTTSTTNEVLTVSAIAAGSGGVVGSGVGGTAGRADDDDRMSSVRPGGRDAGKVQSDAETLNTPHVVPYHDVTAADCRFVASPMDTTHRTLCETVEKWRSAVAMSSAPVVVSAASGAVADKPAKTRLVRKLSPPKTLAKMPKLVKLSPPTSATTPSPMMTDRQQRPSPIAVPKLVQLTVATPVAGDLTVAPETVREKLKRQIVQKTHTTDVELVHGPDPVPAAFSTRVATSDSSEENNIKAPPQPVEYESTSKKCPESTADPSAGHRFERNRAAAQRYRSKMKMGKVEMQLTNARLEEENRSLRAELQKVKALLLAHQSCPVTKAMAQGKSIPVGQPTMIIKPAVEKCPSNKRPIRPHQPAVGPAVPVTATLLSVSSIASVDITKTPIFYLVNQTKPNARTC